MENSSKKPTNRAVAIIPEGIEFPSFLAGFAIEKTSFVDISALAERPFVLIIAPRKDFLQHTIQQIRSHSQTALMPLIVAGGENQQEDNPLIDVSVPLLFSDSQIRQAFEKAISLSEKISRFTPPPDSLEAREQGWLNLVRFLSSRGGFKLAPSWNIKTPSGYEYPPVATILDTQQEETAQLQLLTQMGLLEKTFYDKIHLCPRCRHFQLNFREVCPHCNKSNVEPEENFHHYSCSFVAPRREFMSGGVLACPKCHKKLKALGVDYDKSSVSHYCNSCKKKLFRILGKLPLPLLRQQLSPRTG